LEEELKVDDAGLVLSVQSLSKRKLNESDLLQRKQSQLLFEQETEDALRLAQSLLKKKGGSMKEVKMPRHRDHSQKFTDEFNRIVGSD